MEGYSFFAILILIGWVIFLISLLGNTATNYFSSTLASICGKLNLSYDIAGVTFLAFGNGAPDVFSSIASLTGGSDALIGIGSVLGGSVFVTTIVVGSVAIICPCKVAGLSFTRDVVFYLIVAVLLAIITISGEVTLFLAILLFAVYIAYAIAVLISSYYQREWDNLAKPPPVFTGPQIQAAYWYQTTPTPGSSLLSATAAPTRPSTALQSANAPGETTYKFLILDELDRDRSDGESDDEDETVINLSGGLLSAEFSAEIIENYCDQVHGTHFSGKKKPVATAKPKAKPKIKPMDIANDSLFFNDGLTTSLLSTDDNEGGEEEEEDFTFAGGDIEQRGEEERLRTNFKRNANKATVASSLYWQQLLLRRRLQRSVMAADWWSYSLHLKVLALIEYPVVLARDLTIPTIDDIMWYKPYAVVQPVAALMFLLLVTDQMNDTIDGVISVSLVFFLVGIALSIAVFFTTHYGYPPKGLIFSTLWVFFSFAMCIAWIYLLAGELVACLSSLGVIFNIPPIYLGLTVLAWGNSIGDFFANVAVARRGLGPMALAGCYGGPVFDILIGLGFALSIACSQEYPEPFKISYDTSSVVSLVFLFLSLSSTLIVVTWRGYQLEAWFGYFLIGLYGLHTFVQAIFLLTRSS